MKSNKKHLSRGLSDDKVVISSEYYKNDRPSFICNVCNCTLSKLTDSSGQNPSFYCARCNIEFDPESENVRRESKLSVPDRNVEPAVATAPGIDTDSVAIRHEPEIKGGLKTLRDRGMKITHYEEHIPK
jgi:uncharacterized Zn ribbon protein